MSDIRPGQAGRLRYRTRLLANNCLSYGRVPKYNLGTREDAASCRFLSTTRVEAERGRMPRLRTAYCAAMTALLTAPSSASLTAMT